MNQKTRIESALAALTEEGKLTPGQMIPVERLEKVFGFDRSSQEFGWIISGVRNRLYDLGLYLSGEGVGRSGLYSILDQIDNHWVAKLAMARAERDLEGKQRLLLNTNLDGFNDLQRSRHESTLHTLALRLNALRKVAEYNRKTGAKHRQFIETQSEEI